MATRALAASEIHHLDESESDRYVGSFVGPAAIRELRSWMVNVDLPDPAELLDGKIEWQHDPDRLDRTMVVCSSCAALVAPHSAEKRMPRAEAAWKLIHKGMAEHLRPLGYTSVEAFLPPSVSERFGRRLERTFGWVKNWPSWTRRF